MRLLLFVLLSSSVGTAEPLESRYLERMSAARDARTVARLQTEYTELKITRSACRIQLADKIVPLACYQALQLETRGGMHPSVPARRALTLKLDALCRRYASEGPTEDATAAVSPACRAWLNEAREIRNYREGG